MPSRTHNDPFRCHVKSNTMKSDEKNHSRQEPRKQLIQAPRPEARRRDGVLEVQPVGVELGHAAGRDHDARRVAAELDQIEGV